MREVKALIHIHTKASYDGVMNLDYILKYCCKHGIEILSVADHDFLHPDEAVSKAKQYNVTFIPSIEYSTKLGDVIGLFIKRISTENKYQDIMDDISSQKGLSLLPHPLKGHALNIINMMDFDILEAFNSRCTPKQNDDILNFCRTFSKPYMAGVDAHFPWEIGGALTIFKVENNMNLNNTEELKNIFLHSPREYTINYCPQWSIKLSRAVKGIKQNNFKLSIKSLTGALKSFLVRN
jgi:predicted metal-dependent phosphoesterase TrpH